MNTVSATPKVRYLLRAHVAGFSLVELMVAMVLGLLVSGSAVGIFISNRQANRATDSLSRIQENARTAFELMARDVREAGGNPCGRNLLVTSVINGAGANWWDSLANPVIGYDDGIPFPDDDGTRVAGTDAIEIKSAEPGSLTVTEHDPVAAEFKVNTVNHGLNDGDVAVACDGSQATVFQITNASPGTNVTVVHNTGATVTPGNCSKGLGFPTVCSAVGNSYQYGANSVLTKLRARRWFIGNNLRGDRSLYQAALRTTGGVAVVTNEEITEGVRDMQITYLFGTGNDYVAANAVPAGAWNQVRAVRINLTMQGLEAVGTDGTALNRSLAQTVALRNRMP